MPKIIDLSTTLSNFGFDPRPPQIVYWEHGENARYYCRRVNVPLRSFPDEMALAVEEVHAITHTGTHLDAPWHFGPTAEGRPAKTIDQVPLEWCYGDGVLLDLRHKKKGEIIGQDDLAAELARIDYTVKPGDIVLAMVLGGDLYLGDPDYPDMGAGLDGDAVLWLLDKGVKIIGTDAWSLDISLSLMAQQYREGKREFIWPAHFAGRVREYCHIEKLANLEQLPQPYGFKLACFPVKIARASAAWCRAVAIFG
ncbi:MAG TPA: cyclase family protein [Firmicutes bacterium]|nr:cyclase family protein [Bacillota bacterium]